MNDIKPSLWATLYKFKIHHILLWIAYYVFWVTMYINLYPIWDLLLIVSIYFVFLASAFYGTAYYLFPQFLYKQKVGLFFVLFSLLALILSAGQGYFLHLMIVERSKDVPAEVGSLRNMILFSFVSIITMVGLLAGAKLIAEKIRTDRVNRTRDQQRLESELQYLKAQVNPHFLFNAINSVYFLIKKDPEKAAETLIKLSDLLRFQLYDCSDEKIAIEKEVEYIHNFITLEKIRRGEKVVVDLDVNGSLSGFQISPFMLMPFIENAFKHVSNSANGGNKIWIKLHRKENELLTSVENTTETSVVNGVGGIGLKNVKRRLELLYPESHKLLIQEGQDKYSVQLSLKIE